MEPGRWVRITDIYHATIARPPEERASFLGEECHGDESLRKQVEAMVKSHERSGDFIESPAFAVAPELLLEEPPGDLIGQLIGHYRIESFLGVGGMGEVYLARDEQLGRKVALKLLPERLTADEAHLSRFKTEARSASALNHPNILTVHEIGAEGNRHFIATEFIEGITLRELLARGPVDLHDALEIAVQVASALAAAHETGVVHRDIKPENIMLRPDGYVKLLDFGIAKLTEQQPESDFYDVRTTAILQTRPGLVLGTGHYMSPEQARGQTVDARSDIWTLGVVIYEMVGGTSPFPGETPSDCLVSILTKDPPPLAEVLSGVPVKLQAIVQKALCKNSAGRYQTIKAMLSDLRNLKGELEARGSWLQTRAWAEFIVSKTRLHKRAGLLTLATALLAAAASAYHFYFVTPAPSPNEKSIAVLPFADLSQARDQEYFCDGIQEEILTRLSKIADLKVISRTSTRRFKSAPDNLRKIALQLGVANILEGTVQKSEGQVRVNVQLINAKNDSHLWGERYDRKLTDVFGVEGEIATTIAVALQAKLTSTEEHALSSRPTENPEAHQLYLKGRYFWNRRTSANLKKAIGYFQQAIEKDPGYALAYAGLSDAYVLLPAYAATLPRDDVPRAMAAAKKALQLDDTLAEAHASLANALVEDLQFDQSIKEFQHAIELNPNYATAHHWYAAGPLTFLRRFDEALSEARRAQELDPLSVIINVDIGRVLLSAGRYDEAIAQLRTAIELEPGFYYAHWNLGRALEGKGSLREAIAEYRKAVELDPVPVVLGSLGHAYAGSGQQGEALKILDTLTATSQQQYVPAIAFSFIYVGLGDAEQALRFLEKSYDDRAAFDLQALMDDRSLDPLRGHPRFERLVAKVLGSSENTARAQPAESKSIAVLPFENLSNEPDNAYFADGIQGEILTRLSKVADLKVISRTSTQRYKDSPNNLLEIAKRLGVAHILEGTVQKSADQVRVTVQLINAQEDSHLWADKYDRKLTDIFAVESEIAGKIADTLQAKLSSAEQMELNTRPTESTEAHQLYLRGRYVMEKRTPADLNRAADYFNQALAQDPNYAAAYAGLADCYVLLPQWKQGPVAEYLSKARAAAIKALQIDGNLADAHVSLGMVAFGEKLDLREAKREFERAIQLNPNYALAHYCLGYDVLLALGNHDQAIAELNRAIELDPVSGVINTNLGCAYMLARRYPEAIAQLRKTIELNPGFAYAHAILGEALELNGQLDDAFAEYEKSYNAGHDFRGLMMMARVHGLKGDRAKALRMFEQAKQLNSPDIWAFGCAMVYLGLGDRNEALNWLEQSYQQKEFINVSTIKDDPLFDPLHGDPRFEKLVNQIIPPNVIPAGATSISEKSIAVLPFENRSEDKSNAYFADGVQDEVLTRLSKIGDLKVISRTSTQRYKNTSLSLAEIAKQLGVANLLEGSVQKTNDKVRVNVQLIRAADDSHLWADTFDRRLTDIFAVESEVASAIADKLQATLTGSEQRALASKPTVNLDAYDAYLHGLEFDRRTELPADLLEAKRYLELAVKLDPTFALAWARLGRVEANFYFQDIDIHPARLDAARNAVETAVRLQPDLGESWLASGYYHLYCERNRELARAAFENARQRLPNDSDVLFALSIVDRSQEQPDNALALQTEALRLDPRNASLFFQQGETFAALRRFNEARAAADNALMITPNDRYLKAFKASTYQAEGDLARAHQTFGENSSEPWTARAYPLQLRQLMLERNYADMISRLQPLLAERAPSTAINQDGYYWLLGMARKLTGDLKGARSTFAQGRDFLLATIQKSGGPHGAIHATVALMYAGAGDKPNALREAKRAVELEGDDTYYAPAAEEVLAIIEVQTGETASAVARLPKLLKAHYFSWGSFAPLTPALLRIDPVWDPLRDDPRFQKLAVSPTSKDDH